jgi:hypothetical protein
MGFGGLFWTRCLEFDLFDDDFSSFLIRMGMELTVGPVWFPTQFVALIII